MLNLIFDLDQTLIDSVAISETEPTTLQTDKRHTEIFIINEKYKGKTSYIITCRPYSSFLLRYCFKNFNVGFWTAGTLTYGLEILKKLLYPEEFKKCICIIGRTKSTISYWKCKDHNNNIEFKIPTLDGHVTKPLSLLFNDNKNYRNFKESNTILIDNSPWNIIPNQKNSIYIVNSCTQKSDNLLFLLYKKLDTIKNTKDVTKIDFKEYFKSSYDVVSCLDIYKTGLYQKKNKYEIGDCIESSIYDGFYIILDIIDKSSKSKSKTKLSKTKQNKIKQSKTKLNKTKQLTSIDNIKYVVCHYFNGEPKPEKLTNKSILHKVVV